MELSQRPSSISLKELTIYDAEAQSRKPFEARIANFQISCACGKYTIPSDARERESVSVAINHPLLKTLVIATRLLVNSVGFLPI